MSNDVHGLLRALLHSMSEEIQAIMLQIQRKCSHDDRSKHRRSVRSRTSPRPCRNADTSGQCWYHQTLSLLPFRKRRYQALNAASSPGESARGGVLFIHELNSGKRFMTLAPSPLISQIADGSTVVNRTSIKTYGQRMLKLDLGLRRSFPHVFIVADVPHPIIGASLMTQLAYQ